MQGFVLKTTEVDEDLQGRFSKIIPSSLKYHFGYYRLEGDGIYFFVLLILSLWSDLGHLALDIGALVYVLAKSRGEMKSF